MHDNKIDECTMLEVYRLYREGVPTGVIANMLHIPESEVVRLVHPLY